MNHHSQPLVSIVMNCYNGEKYLKQAIDSIYAQTYTNWEIIFWDNASTDRSKEIAISFDAKLRYFRSPINTPLGQARFEAMKQILGDFVCFLDTDDEWRSEKLETQVKVMLDTNCTLCYAGIEEVFETGEHIRNYHPNYFVGNMFDKLLLQFDVNMVTPMIRVASLVESALFFNPDVHGSEEYNLFMRIAAKYSVCSLPTILGKIRVRNSSLTSKTIEKWAKERFLTLNQVKLENPEIEKKFPREFAEAYARGHYYLSRYFMSENNKIEARSALKNALGVNWKYKVFYFLTFLPVYVWKSLHLETIKRRLSGVFSG